MDKTQIKAEFEEVSKRYRVLSSRFTALQFRYMDLRDTRVGKMAPEERIAHETAKAAVKAEMMATEAEIKALDPEWTLKRDRYLCSKSPKMIEYLFPDDTRRDLGL